MAARDRSNEEVDQDCGGANFASVPKRDGTDRVAALTRPLAREPNLLAYRRLSRSNRAIIRCR